MIRGMNCKTVPEDAHKERLPKKFRIITDGKECFKEKPNVDTNTFLLFTLNL